MAFGKAGPSIPGVTASVDLSAAQFLFVKINGETTIGLAGAGEAVDGVLQNNPVSGVAATVWSTGSTTKVVAGALVAAGADVTPDAAGKAVTSATGNYIAGKCLTASSAADELITVQLTNPGRTL